MFKINLNEERHDTFKRRVVIHQPTNDGTSKHEIGATFLILTRSQIQEQIAEEREAATADDPTDADVLRKVLVGWDDVATEDGPLEFNEANRDALIDIPYVRTALIAAYFTAVTGGDGGPARRKGKN